MRVEKLESKLKIIEAALKEIDCQVKGIEQGESITDNIKTTRDNISELQMFLMSK